jgi:hypothetical protein
MRNTDKPWSLLVVPLTVRSRSPSRNFAAQRTIHTLRTNPRPLR